LVEPTETESKESLDHLIVTMRALVERAVSGDAEAFHAAPIHAPRRRFDETSAARQPVLRWRPPADASRAAE
jgi:glycine dehydrogenase subunit 2